MESYQYKEGPKKCLTKRRKGPTRLGINEANIGVGVDGKIYEG